MPVIKDAGAMNLAATEQALLILARGRAMVKSPLMKWLVAPLPYRMAVFMARDVDADLESTAKRHFGHA